MNNPRIIICRHAESIEDVDNGIYDKLNDLSIPLTEKGIEQAQSFGAKLNRLTRNRGGIQFYTSPGLRNRQTLEIVLSKLTSNKSIEINVEPLIVKQNWGEITSQNRPSIEIERYKIGVLRYTFPTGESAASMIDRLIKFKNKVFKLQKITPVDIVVFSHGFEFRVLLMVIMGWNEELFESFGNLKNCEYRILKKMEDGVYSLNRSLKKHGLPITRLGNNV